MLCRSRLERAMRSSLVTTTMSPGLSRLSSLTSSGRPLVFLPLALSAVDVLAAGGLKRLDLRGVVLRVGGDAGVSELHENPHIMKCLTYGM